MLHCILRCVHLQAVQFQAPKDISGLEGLSVNFDTEHILNKEFPAIDWTFIHDSLQYQKKRIEQKQKKEIKAEKQEKRQSSLGVRRSETITSLNK